MITIMESGMTFGPFDEEMLYHIEKSRAYAKIGGGIKSVEFICKKNSDKLFFIEAKSSSPKPEDGEFENYISEIVDKFIHSFNLWLTLKLDRKKDDVPPKILDAAMDKQIFRFILVINGHEVEWLSHVKAAIEQKMMPEIKIWKHAIIVLNEVEAKKRGLVQTWKINRKTNTEAKYIELFNSEGDNIESEVLNGFFASLSDNQALKIEENIDQTEKELEIVKRALSRSELSGTLKQQWLEKIDQYLA